MLTLIEKLRAQAPRKFDVIGLGECSLDQVFVLPGRLRDFVGGKSRAMTVRKLGGGQVATALCAAARLGSKTAFLGAVGDDGDSLLSELQFEGVSTESVFRAAGAATRSALLLVDEDGERTVIEHRDRTLSLPLDYPPAEFVSLGRVLHVDATYMAATLRAAQTARRQGMLISIDLDPINLQAEKDQRIDEKRQEIGELLALADLCVVPAAFALAFTHQVQPEAAARKLCLHTPGQVVLTLGAAGSLAIAGSTIVYQPALLPPAQVVDTTACGDTFRGALIAYLLDLAKREASTFASSLTSCKSDMLTAGLRFASAAATLKCQGYGRSGCPSRAALDEFLTTSD